MDVGDITARLNVDIGNGLSSMQQFADSVKSVGDAAGQANSPVQTLTESIVAAGQASSYVDALKTAIGALGVDAASVSQSIQDWAAAMDAAANAAKAAGDAMGGASEGARQYSDAAQSIFDKQAQANDALEQAQQALAEIRAAFDSGAAGANELARAENAVEQAARAANPALQSIRDTLDSVQSSQKQYSDGVQAIIDKQAQLDAKLASAQQALTDIRQAFDTGAVGANELARAEDAVAKAMEAANPAAKQVADALEAAQKAQQQYSDGAQAVIDKQAQLDSQLASAQAALAEVQQAFYNGAASADAVARAAENVGKAFDAAHPGFKSLNDDADQAKTSFAGLADELLKFAGISLTAAGVKQFGEAIMAAADDVTRTDIALTKLTGDGAQAADMMDRLAKLGVADGLSMPQLHQAAINMENLLPAGSDVVGILAEIADAGAVTGKGVDAAASAFDRLINSTAAPSIKVLQGLGLNFDSLGQAMVDAGISADKMSVGVKAAWQALDEHDKIVVAQTALLKFQGTAEDIANNTFSGVWHQAVAQFDVDIELIIKDLGKVGDKLPDLKPLVNDLAAAFTALATFVKAAVDDVTSNIVALGVQLQGLGKGAADAMKGNFQQAAKDISDAMDIASQVTKKASDDWTNTIAAGQKTIHDLMSQTKENVQPAIDALDGFGNSGKEAIEKVSDKFVAYSAALREFHDISSSVTSDEQSQSDVMTALANKVADTAKSIDNAKQSLGFWVDQLNQAEEGSNEYTEAQRQVDVWLAQVEKDQSAYNKAIDDFNSKSDLLANKSKQQADAIKAISQETKDGLQNLKDLGVTLDQLPQKISPVNQALGDAGVHLKNAADSAKDARGSFDNLNSELPTVVAAFNSGGISAQQFDQYIQAMGKDISQMAKVDLPGAVAEQGKLVDSLIATSAPLGVIQTEMAKYQTGINKLAHEDLPDAIAEQERYTQELIASNAPLGQILDSQQKQIQLQIQLAQQSGQSTGALLIDLENVKLKQEEVKASLEGWGPAYVQAVANIQAAFTSLTKGLADIIVAGKNAQEVFAGIWKSFATQEVNLVIQQGLKPIENAFLNLGNHAGDAAKKIADSASTAGKSLSQMGEAEAMSAEAGDGAAKGAENLSTGMDGLSKSATSAMSSFSSFASTLSGFIAVLTAAYEAGKLLGSVLRDVFSGPSSLNITSNIPIAGLSGSQVTDLAKWLGLDTSNMAGLGTQGNPLTNPGQSPTADQTAGAIGALTTEIQRLTELQTGLSNEMIQAYDKGQIYLGDTLSKDLDTVANAIKSEQDILAKISGNTGATADGTQAVVATNGQMYSALGSATAQLISMQGQQATLQSELIAAQASGNTALATALQSQLDKLNSSIGGQTTLLQQVTDAVKTLSPDILAGFQTLQEGFKAITDLKSSPELEQAMNNLRVALESGDISSIDKATGVLQQILIGVNNPPAVVTAINALQEAIKSGDTAAIAQATTTLQSVITTSASNSATAISAAEKEVGDAIVTGNAAALSKGLADLSTAIAAAGKQQGADELAAMQAGLKPTADQISGAIGSLQTDLDALQSRQTDLNNDLIIAVASGDQNLIAAVQTELGKVNTSIQNDQGLLDQINKTTGDGADKVVSSVDGVKASTDQMAQAVANAQSAVDSLKSHLSDLNQQLIVAEAEGNSTLVATLEKQIGDTNTLLNTANGTLSQIDQDISAANPVNDNSGVIPTADQSADAAKNLQNTINGYLAQETDINNQIKIALSEGDTKQVEKLEAEWNRIDGLLTGASQLMKQLTGGTGLPGSTGASGGGGGSSLPSNALTNDEMGKLTAQQLAAYNNATKAVNDLKAQQIPLQNQLIAAEAAGNSTLVKTIQDQLSKLNGQITSANTTLTDVVVAIRAGNSATTGAGGAGAGTAGGVGTGSTPVSQGGGQQPTVPGQSVFFPTTASGQWDPEFQLREIAKQIQDNSAVIQMGNDTGNDIFNEQLGKMNATLLAQQALLQNPPSNPSAAVMDLRTQITMDTQQMITAWLNGDRAGADSIRQKIDEEIGKLADISKADDSTAGSVANVEKAAIDQRNAALASLSEATTTKEKIAALTEQMKADEILATEEAKQGHQDAANAYSKEAIALQAQLNELQNNGRDIRDTKASSDKVANNTEKTAANTLRSAAATENARADLAKQQMDLLQNLAGLALAIATGDAGLATVFANKIAENIAAIKEDQGILNGIAENTKRTADNTDGIGSIADAISSLKDSIGSTRGGADTQTSSTGRAGNNTGTDASSPGTSSPGQVPPPTGNQTTPGRGLPHYAEGGAVAADGPIMAHASETVISPGLTTQLQAFLDSLANSDTAMQVLQGWATDEKSQLDVLTELSGTAKQILAQMQTAASGGGLSGSGGGITPTSPGSSSGGSSSSGSSSSGSGSGGGTSTTTPQGTFATPPAQPGMPITSDAFGGAFDPTAATTFGSPAWIKAQVANAAKSGGSFDPTAATSFGSPAWIKAQVAGNKALDPTAATTFGSPAWLKAQVAGAQPALSSGLKTHPGLVGPPLAATPEQLAALKAAADAADAAANAAKGDAAGKDHIAKALEDSIASMQLTVEELTTKLQLQRGAAAQARAQATDTGDPAMAKQADLAESIAESYDQQLTAQVKALNDTKDRATKARADADAAAKIAADKQSAADAADAAYGSAKSGAGPDTGGFTTISSAFENPEQEGSFPQLSGPTRGTSTVGGSGHVNQDITLKSGSTMSQDQVDALTKYAQEHPANGGMPHYALGGYVPTDGPIYAHRGETVIDQGLTKQLGDYLKSLGGTSLDGLIASHLKHPFDPSAAMNIGGSLGAGGGLVGGVKQGPVPGASGGNVTVHAPVTFNGYTDTAKMYKAWAGHVKGVTKNAAPFSS